MDDVGFANTWLHYVESATFIDAHAYPAKCADDLDQLRFESELTASQNAAAEAAVIAMKRYFESVTMVKAHGDAHLKDIALAAIAQVRSQI
ncbi:hypothetical protein [Rhizobium tumorigenes]|uniref:hypothetical protein n=1 Tax=Rhizobium tumorigenes TaxID=2041385 RepID=UPI00241EEDDF|nr:hypothetical protein [Rhizobium tumorigenes]WFS02759.1 hypothetical protein PR016_09230 [Rhizobium tumorigenes]